jgi:catechol 2,3-dioxygenase-like lactoylglutathione lyase family enzyme
MRNEGPVTIEARGLCPLLQVFDMPTSLAFYRDVVGFNVTMQSQPDDECDWCMLQLGDAYLMLNTAYERDLRPGRPDPARIAAHDDTGLFIRCPDVDAAYAHLRARGVALDPPKVAPYGMKQLYLKDPDGFVICFQWTAEKAGPGEP